MSKDKCKIYKEKSDFEYGLAVDRVFSGNISGTITITYEPSVPYGSSTQHLGSRLSFSGITLNSMTRTKYFFSFSNITFYALLYNLEYIRAYSKYRSSKIMDIQINITKNDDSCVEMSD